MTQIVVGIDPGLSGAIAALSASWLAPLIEDMPIMARGSGSGRVKNEVDPARLAAILRGWTEGQRDEALVVIERVSAMPGQGVAGMFSIGDSLGCARAVAAALGIPTQWVTPQAWKKHYGLPADKELSRARAIQLYPSLDLSRKKDHGRAEALLIARYGWEALR